MHQLVHGSEVGDLLKRGGHQRNPDCGHGRVGGLALVGQRKRTHGRLWEAVYVGHGGEPEDLDISPARKLHSRRHGSAKQKNLKC